MYSVYCFYVLILLNMPEMAHVWINKVFYSILKYAALAVVVFSDHHYWVGGRQTPGDLNDWQWIDGTPFNYTFWEDHEPDDVGEECSLMEYEHHQLWLENKNCELTFKYVCEIL